MKQQTEQSQTVEARYTFAGRDCDYETFKRWSMLRDKGICPFCGRHDLSNRYGNAKKHTLACIPQQM